MTPGEIFRNMQAEMEADPTMIVTVDYDRELQKYKVVITSSEEQRSASAQSSRMKDAFAKAINEWNGDEENGHAR